MQTGRIVSQVEGVVPGNRGVEIEEHESRVRDLETALLSFVSVEETARLSRELKENRATLDELLKEWEETSQLIAAHA